MNYFEAITLGILEGFTEFLPISSTAHLLLGQKLLGIAETDFTKSFTIVIQLGAILAVALLYVKRLVRDKETNKRIIIAFIPTAVIGFALYKLIKGVLFENHSLMLWMLLIGGLILIIFEKFRAPQKESITNLATLPYSKAFWIGCAQALAVVPGVSRAAATIIGGELLGVSRKAIVEFSFMLAIPTMAAASAYDLYKSAGSFADAEFGVLAVGFIVSSVFAYVAVRWLLRFIEKHSWNGFGIYRIVLAAVFFWLLNR